MNWNTRLENAETLQWQGRPAPRCYVFRRWKTAVFGTLLLVLAAWWQWMGIKLARGDYPAWLALLPTAVLLLALWLSIGRLLRARLRWERVFYAISDSRLLVSDGDELATLPLAEITYFRLQRHGEQLGTLTVFAGSVERQLEFECIEYPGAAVALLESAMEAAGHLDDQSESS